MQISIDNTGTRRQGVGSRTLVRVATLAAGLVGVLAASAAPALATFHLEMVNEVMLASGSGDSSVQFVELLDDGGAQEQFTPVFAPYKLVAYDAAGNKLGEHMLNPTGLRNAAGGDTEYLISTAAADAAFGVTGDERLDFVLPTSAGQVCFEGNPNPPDFSCITYGSISKPVPTNSNGTGSVHGPVPPNGQSDQRQRNGSVQAAAPTPKAANRAGTGTPPGGGSTTPPGSSGTTSFAGASFSSHRAKLGHNGRVGVAISCPASASGSCTGRLDLRSRRGQHALGHVSFTLSAAARAVIKVKLSARTRHSLRRRGKLVADATLTVHDASGQSRTGSTQLTLVAA